MFVSPGGLGILETADQVPHQCLSLLAPLLNLEGTGGCAELMRVATVGESQPNTNNACSYALAGPRFDRQCS